MLITQGPHVQDIATYWRIKLLHMLQEVGCICKTRNHLSDKELNELYTPTPDDLAFIERSTQSSIAAFGGVVL
jgi:hypothetical protein